MIHTIVAPNIYINIYKFKMQKSNENMQRNTINLFISIVCVRTRKWARKLKHDFANWNFIYWIELQCYFIVYLFIKCCCQCQLQCFYFFCCFLLQSSVSFTWQIAVSVQNDSPNWITFAGHSRARNFNFGIDKERVEEGDGDSEVLQLNPICNVFILPYKLKYFFNCCPCCRVAEKERESLVSFDG